MKTPYPITAEHFKHNGHPWVLVVEDDSDLRWSTLMMLQDEGVKALGAANGVEVFGIISVALHENSLPCVIFLDINMPLINGWEILYWFEVAQPRIQSIPVVITTGEELGERLAELVNTRVVKKPYTVESILDEINRALRRNPCH